jgi:hypothetical protein
VFNALSLIQSRIGTSEGLRSWTDALCTKANALDAVSLFQSRIETVEDLRSWSEALSDLVLLSGHNARDVSRALSLFQSRIETPEDLHSWGEALCGIAVLARGRTYIVDHGLTIFKDRVRNVAELRPVGTMLARIAAFLPQGDPTPNVFDPLTLFRSRMETSEDLISWSEALGKIALVAQQDTPYVLIALSWFHLRIENAEDLRFWGEALYEIQSLSGSGTSAHWVRRGLAILKDRVHNIAELKLVGRILTQIASVSRGELEGVLESGIPRIAERFNELLTNKAALITELRNVRATMRSPYWDDPNRYSGLLSTGGAVAERVDPDGAIGIDNTIAALDRSDFSELAVVTSSN